MTRSLGIPRIIHQTWKSENIPEGMGCPQSWKDHNPDWTYQFWTDDDLLKFFETVRPDLLDLFLSYPNPVQRADLARYCILFEYGGIYADIDTQCHASLEPIVGDPRVILCEEPPKHWGPAIARGFDTLLFNGTMASPPKHPFWQSLIDLCCLMADRKHMDVLENTGPLLLTAAAVDWPNKEEISINSCGLFADQDDHGQHADEPASGDYGHLHLSTHLWAGSWYNIDKGAKKWPRILSRMRQFKTRFFSGPRLNPERVQRDLDQNLLQTTPEKQAPDGELLVLIPVRNSEDYILRCFDLIAALDHPRDRLHVWFGHGNSTDATAQILDALITDNKDKYASVGVIHTNRNAPQLSRHKRWKQNVQRVRRSGIAKARNDLLDGALRPEHDWVLWIDADVIDYPSNVVQQLASIGKRIVVPNCVLETDGPSFDLNSFLNICTPNRVALYRNVHGGLLQPKTDWFVRRHLHDLRYLNQVPLHGIGGTMILIDANCHRAGLRFPEQPYKFLIETEGLGMMATDAGVQPYGMPKVEIKHAPS